MRKLTYKEQIKWMMDSGEFNMYETKNKSSVKSDFEKIKKSEKTDGEKAMTDDDKKLFLKKMEGKVDG